MTRPAPRLLLAVAVGGAAGAVARYLLGQLAPVGSGFPWTTFGINGGGCTVLAALELVPVLRRAPVWAAAVGPGVLGGFTTFSAYSEQVRSLLDSGEVAVASAYLLGTLAVCLAAVALVGRLAPPLPPEDD